MLRNANLDSAQGDGVSFRGANLTNASLRGVRFLSPDFRGADLTGVDFTNALLKAADFRGAILDGVIWIGADTTSARFDAGAPPRTEPVAAKPDISDALDGVSDLIRQAVADPRFAAIASEAGKESEADTGLVLKSLREQLQARGIDVSESIALFEKMLALLQAEGSEPPAEWQPWLESLMRNPPPEFAALFADIEKKAHREAQRRLLYESDPHHRHGHLRRL